MRGTRRQKSKEKGGKEEKEAGRQTAKTEKAKGNR